MLHGIDIVWMCGIGLGIVTQGSNGTMRDYLVRYHNKAFGERVVDVSDMQPCNDFDWCNASDQSKLPLDAKYLTRKLAVDARVEGRYLHAQGQRQPYLQNPKLEATVQLQCVLHVLGLVPQMAIHARSRSHPHSHAYRKQGVVSSTHYTGARRWNLQT
jgi:hypothetical protein